MFNACEYRIVMNVKADRSFKCIRAMFLYENEIREYYKENAMEKNWNGTTYEMQKLNRMTGKWNKIY